jgi:5-methylcytosine-specific restriction enzyme subunit McrC
VSNAGPVFDLSEWDSHVVDGLELSDEDRSLARKVEAVAGARLGIEELRSGVHLTSRSSVGVVQFETFGVRVLPNLVGDELGLVRMLEFAVGFEALRRIPGDRLLRAAGSSLLDLIALLLAEAAETIIRQGVLRDYIERLEDLALVRGRLLADRQILSRFGQIDRLICAFDEHEHDVWENQLVAAALGRCAYLVRDPGVLAKTRQTFGIFRELCDPEALDPMTLSTPLEYTRQNERYRDAHALARLLLQGLGVEDILSRGPTKSFAFFIDMAPVFERFVFRIVQKLFERGPYRVEEQSRWRSIVWNDRDSRPYADVKPDVVVENYLTKGRVSIDAKYKPYGERKLAPEDVYQAFIYGYILGDKGKDVPSSIIIYPASRQSTEVTRLSIRRLNHVPASRVIAFGVPISRVLDEAKRGFQGPTLARLLEEITAAMGEAASDLPMISSA